jgi:hypothetical protein
LANIHSLVCSSDGLFITVESLTSFGRDNSDIYILLKLLSNNALNESAILFSGRSMRHVQTNAAIDSDDMTKSQDEIQCHHGI